MSIRLKSLRDLKFLRECAVLFILLNFSTLKVAPFFWRKCAKTKRLKNVKVYGWKCEQNDCGEKSTVHLMLILFNEPTNPGSICFW